MSFLRACFLAAVRPMAARRRTWLLMLLLPLLTWGGTALLPAREVSAPVQVGVVLPREGAEQFWSLLEERSGVVAEFVAADEDTARRQVAAGRWDCALVLPDDFARRLEQADFYRAVTLLISPGSTVYPMVREAAGSVLLQCVSPTVARQYLLHAGIAGREEAADLESVLEQVLRDRVEINLETADGLPLEPIALAADGRARLLAGVTATLVLCWALLAAVDLGRWLDSPFARRLAPLRGRTALLLLRAAAALAPVLVSGCLALWAVGGPAGAAALVPYLLLLGGVGTALARRPALWSALPVLLPFVPAAGLLLSPALVDLSLLMPAAAPVVRWNPVTLFLRCWDGDVSAGLLLTALALLVLLPQVLWDRRGAARALKT